MDINNFGPFNAEVWGTVSDWSIAFITIITALLLYSTFKSQINVQKNQQRITDIESERFRIEYKPILQLTVDTITNKTLETHTQSYIHISLKIIENDCKDLNILVQNNVSTVDNVSVSKNHTGLAFPIDYIYQPDNYDLHFTISSLTQLFPHEGATLWFFLEFDDVIGNSYRQEFIYIFQDSLKQTFVKNPERLLDRARNQKPSKK